MVTWGWSREGPAAEAESASLQGRLDGATKLQRAKMQPAPRGPSPSAGPVRHPSLPSQPSLPLATPQSSSPQQLRQVASLANGFTSPPFRQPAVSL